MGKTLLPHSTPMAAFETVRLNKALRAPDSRFHAVSDTELEPAEPITYVSLSTGETVQIVGVK